MASSLHELVLDARCVTEVVSVNMHDVLGEGANGKVYGGMLGDQRVAVKFLPAKSHVEILHARNEVACHLACSGHPNVVGVLGAFAASHNELAGIPCVVLVTERLAGGELFYRVRDGPKLTGEQVRDVTQQLASALEHLHAVGITHGDVKLENTLLTTPWQNQDTSALFQVKITDFGFASAGLKADMRRYTPAYVPPEQLLVAALQRLGLAAPVVLNSPRDLWSLGVLLYFVLERRPPFFSKLKAVPDVSHPAPVPVDMRSDILEANFAPFHTLHAVPADLVEAPQSFNEIVAKLLRKDQRDRPTATELLAVMQ